MAGLGPVVETRVISAPRDEVWHHIVDAEARAEWFADVELEVSVSGAVVERADDGETVARSGHVDVVEAGELLSFRWKAPDDRFDTAVILRLADADDDHTRVSIIESGFASLPDAESRVSAAEEFWRSHLASLASAVVPKGTEQAVVVRSSGATSDEVIVGEVVDEDFELDEGVEVVVTGEDVLEIEPVIEAEAILEWEVVIDEDDADPTR